MALLHKCPDGTRNRLIRDGLVGLEDETIIFTCSHCDYRKDAATMRREDQAMQAALLARVRSERSVGDLPAKELRP